MATNMLIAMHYTIRIVLILNSVSDNPNSEAAHDNLFIWCFSITKLKIKYSKKWKFSNLEN